MNAKKTTLNPHRDSRSRERPPQLRRAAAARMLTPEEAAPAAGVSVRPAYRLVEDGLIHFKETPDGLLLVCLNKLNGRGPDA